MAAEEPLHNDRLLFLKGTANGGSRGEAVALVRPRWARCQAGECEEFPLRQTPGTPATTGGATAKIRSASPGRDLPLLGPFAGLGLGWPLSSLSGRFRLVLEDLDLDPADESVADFDAVVLQCLDNLVGPCLHS